MCSDVGKLLCFGYHAYVFLILYIDA
jgi:hypothetical protein